MHRQSHERTLVRLGTPPRRLRLRAVFLIVAILSVLSTALAWEMIVCADPNAMPMSHRDQTGFENRIAEVLADELRADLVYDWYPHVDMIDVRLREGHCDLLLGVPDGHEPLLTTVAYYRSPYAFVYRADAPFEITSFDDEALRDARIALQAIGIPPHDSLIRRGLSSNIVASFGTESYATRADPRARVVEAVVAGEADVGIAWGPVAGYYGSRSDVPVIVRAVSPIFDPPFSSQVFAMTVGMRRGDAALRDQVSYAIANRWEEIQAILDEYGVVLESSQRPTAPRELP